MSRLVGGACICDGETRLGDAFVNLSRAHMVCALGGTRFCFGRSLGYNPGFLFTP